MLGTSVCGNAYLGALVLRKDERVSVPAVGHLEGGGVVGGRVVALHRHRVHAPRLPQVNLNTQIFSCRYKGCN